MKNRKIVLTSLLSMTLLATGCGNRDSSSAETTKPSDNTSENNNTSSQNSVSPAEEFAIAIDAGEGATINGLPERAAEGTNVSFTVSLAEEKQLSYVTMDGENVLEADQNGTFSFIMPKKAVTVAAVTADKRYAINVHQIAGATIAVSSTLAKKDEEVTIRVAVTDPLKSTPNVVVDGMDIIMDAATDAVNTYVGSFFQEGKDVDVEVTLNDASTAATYGVSVKEDCHISIGGLKEHYAAGDTVTFTLGMALGYEPSGDVEVKDASDNTIDVTKNADGSYSFIMPASSVVISMESKASIFSISKNMVNVAGATTDLLSVDNIVVPEYAKYGETVNFSITPNNYYEADTVTVDGNPVVNNGGVYSFTMKDRAVNIDVQAKVRYAPITLTNSDHVTLSAYVIDSNGDYVLANEATYNQKVYIKPSIAANDDGSFDYGVKAIYVKNKSTGNEIKLDLDDNGYYSSYSSTMGEMSYGLTYRVEELSKIFASDNTALGLHKGFAANSITSTRSFNLLDEFGTISYGSYSYPSTVYATEHDEANKTILFGDNKKAVYFNNGSVVVVAADSSSAAYNEAYMKINDKYDSVSASVIKDTDSTYSATKILMRLTCGTTENFFLFDKTSGNQVVYGDLSLTYLSGNDFTDKNTIFDVISNGTVVATFKNDNGNLVDYIKTAAADYTGSYGTLHTNGVGSGTLNGEDITYEMVNQTTMTVRVVSTYMEYAFTITDSGYAEDKVNYPFSGTGYTGIFNGHSISTMKKNGEVNGNYKARLTLDGTFSWESSYTGGINQLDDGTYVSKGYTVTFAPNGTGMLVNTGFSKFFLTKIKTDNYSYNYLKCAFINVGASGYINATKPKDEADWQTYLYYDGSDYQFVTLDYASEDAKDFSVDGTIYTIKDANGTILFSGSTESGAFVAADTHKGTYTGDNGALILSGYGTGTLGDAEITYSEGEEGSVLVKNGLTTYTMTLGDGTYTITDTNTLSIPAFIAGHTFQGSVYDNDEESYTLFISFSGDDFTLSCSTGYGASAEKPTGGYYLKNENVSYTIEDVILTVTLNNYSDTGTISFVINEENETLIPSSNQNVGIYQFVPSSSFTQIA